ncbi:MAG TPA: ATP-binding protein [Streptosporangiaceae bacterium]|nr:ATP-binding protein [Streptosporangiaceae bacterium]
MTGIGKGITAGPPRRFVITGGPSAGKEAVLDEIARAQLPCSGEEAAREIYRRHRARLGRHLHREDRREYSRAVLAAFVAEYLGHTDGIRFYNRGIPDGYGWDRFFGLEPYAELEDANKLYRYDAVLVLDPLDTFEDEYDVVWAQDREIRRVHELIVQGYYDAGYSPIYIPADAPAERLDLICANLRLPRPLREE